MLFYIYHIKDASVCCYSYLFLAITSDRNAKCGMLMCQTDSVSAKPIIGSGRRSYIVSFRVDGKSIMCRTLPSFNSNDVYDDGLVHTGTKCGDDKVNHLFV